jgi:outer membrane autotransporter protein
VVGRLARVKGRLNDPFVYAIGGHSHRKEVDGMGYKNISRGVAIGDDYMIPFDDGRYLRLGGVMAYVNGKATFSGERADSDQRARVSSFTTALYGAYESFDDSNLKTDISAVVGFSYSKNRLQRTWEDVALSTKADSTNIFLRAEAVKNMFSIGGCQLGPWLAAKYHHVRQEGYDERSAIGEVHSDRARFHFMDTVVGINIEKEFLSTVHADRLAKFSLRGGWNFQPLRKNSPYNMSAEGMPISETDSVNYGSRNSAIIIANVAMRMTSNFTLTGTWTGRFSKDATINNISVGAEYAF